MSACGSRLDKQGGRGRAWVAGNQKWKKTEADNRFPANGRDHHQYQQPKAINTTQPHSAAPAPHHHASRLGECGAASPRSTVTPNPTAIATHNSGR